MMLIAWSYGAALLSESSKTFGLTVSSLARSFPYRVQTFPILTIYLSIKSLASIAVAQLSDLSEISEWKTLLHVRVSNWLMSNTSTLGAPGVIVKVDEAKFGKRKYNKGSYREGQWVLGTVNRICTSHCSHTTSPNTSLDTTWIHR